jgi:hypothetical protein
VSYFEFKNISNPALCLDAAIPESILDVCIDTARQVDGCNSATGSASRIQCLQSVLSKGRVGV